MPYIDLNGTSFHYVEFGTARGAGKTVILIHGFPLDGRIWHGVAEALAEQFRVIVPDLRGFGKSTDDSAFTIASLADDVDAIAVKLSAKPYVLAGLSMGGYVALAVAKRHPGSLAALALVDTKCAADNAEGKKGRDEMIETVRTKGTPAIVEQMFPKMLAPEVVAERPEVAGRLRTIMEATPPNTIERALAAMRDREDYTAMLKTLKFPVGIIVGEHDVIAPLTVAEGIRDAAPGSTLTIIPAAGHMSPHESPLAVANAIASFVGP